MLDLLRARLAELDDLRALGRLAARDQRTKMPAGGAPSRAHALATLSRLAHERATADEIGVWLDAAAAEGVDVARNEALARADVEAIRDWLGEHVHRHGRRLDTEKLVPEAFLELCG